MLNKVYAVKITDIFEPAQSGIDSPAALINRVLPMIYLLAGTIAFILIIGGGFMMVQSASSGDAAKTEQGKKAVTYGIIGLIIIFGAFMFTKFLTGFTSGEEIF